MPRKSPGGRRHGRGEYWRVILPDGQATELGLRHEAVDVAIELAAGVRPSSNRMYPG
jgi:hypothetical protein